jgi:signal transduction histidine kinase
MKWHHSLYWRIAVGFVACLALLLFVQGILFVWVLSRSAQTIPNQPPERLAQTIALDVSQAVDRDRSLDVEKYLRDEYTNDAQPFFVVLRDGRTIRMGGSFPEPLMRDAHSRLEALTQGRPFDTPDRLAQGRPFDTPDRLAQGRPFDRQDPPAPGVPFGRRAGPFERGRYGPGQPGFGPFGRGNRPFRSAPIVADNTIIGLVVVPPQPPFTFLLSRYAPTLGLVAIVTLIVGAVLATAVIFGPARKRLRAVEDAARRLGAGDLGARAPAAGRDEVAAVATAFNAMADDLSARAAALTASDRARRQLLADVSHELTTPVTAMRGYLETLRMAELNLDGATRDRYLTIIGDETGRLERIIGDLLELARLDGGGTSLRIDEVPIDHLFARILARHERGAAEAGVVLKTAIAADATVVRGDRDRLEQALQNLAANALRYAPAGSSITLGARRDGQDIVLEVADEGAGIAPEHLPHVFDRFFKAEASRAVRQGAAGSGLGLSIVKAIVERHGGRVAVESHPGRTIFEVRIKS